MPMRKMHYRLYPNAAQLAALEEAREKHRQLYNAALEERIDAYRKMRASISLNDQSASLTVIRNEDPAYAALPRKALLHTLERLDLAFRAFFRRCKAGETRGFPRFKSRDRFSGFGFRTHGDGATFKPNEKKHGKLRLKGVPGFIPARGRPRDQGTIRGLELTRRAHGWYQTVTVEYTPKRDCGQDVVALDWGVTTFVSGVTASGDPMIIENNRIGKQGQLYPVNSPDSGGCLCAVRKRKRGWREPRPHSLVSGRNAPIKSPLASSTMRP